MKRMLQSLQTEVSVDWELQFHHDLMGWVKVTVVRGVSLMAMVVKGPSYRACVPKTTTGSKDGV